MKKAKSGLSIVVIGAIALVVFQNHIFFVSEQSFGVDLYFVKYITPPLPNALILGFCFLIGLSVSFFSYISNKLKFNKVIKLMRYRETSLMELVSSLKQEIKKIKTEKSRSSASNEAIIDQVNQTNTPES